jgi:hypothetical protein
MNLLYCLSNSSAGNVPRVLIVIHGCGVTRPNNARKCAHNLIQHPYTCRISVRHKLASFELAAVRPTPAMLSIMLPPLTMPVVAIRNFRPDRELGQDSPKKSTK